MTPAGTKIEPVPQLDAGQTAGLEIGAPKVFTTSGIPDHVPVKRAVPLDATPDAGTPERIGGERIVSVGPFQTGIIMRLENIAAGLGRADQAVGVANDPVGIGCRADRRDRYR